MLLLKHFQIKLSPQERKQIFLLLFDLVVENSGRLLGLWEVYGSIYFIGAVPIEVMALALVGGTAWALYQPSDFNKVYSIVDISLFSLFGTLGEYVLLTKGLMVYSGGWTTVHAVMGYALTWVILHFLVYNRKKSPVLKTLSSL